MTEKVSESQQWESMFEDEYTSDAKVARDNTAASLYLL